MVIDPAKRNILTELVDDFTADAAITFYIFVNILYICKYSICKYAICKYAICKYVICKQY